MMVGEFDFSKDEKKEMMVGDFDLSQDKRKKGDDGWGFSWWWTRRCNDRDTTSLSVRPTLTFQS
jgi:hypothetical protein